MKTLRSQKLRMLLTHRQLLQSKAIAIENDLRGTLRNFGLKVSSSSCIAVCWPSSGTMRCAGGADLSRHRRRTRSFP